jgi:ABC-type methionine transport system ATPase subunit
VSPGVSKAKTKTGQARCLLHFERKLFNMAKVFKKTARTQPSSPTQRRLWLMFPPKLIKEPLIWKLGQKFKVVTNIRQASVTDEIGIVCLELDGKREDVKAAIAWLEKLGVSVEPVEISVVES